MSKKDPILDIINEAKTYLFQGLVNESRAKFKEARKLIVNDVRIRNKSSLAALIDREIDGLDGEDSYQGDMIAFEQLPSDIRARIRQIDEGVEDMQEEKERSGTGNLPADIIIIEVTIETASAKSSAYELDVTFQEGNNLSVIIPKVNMNLAEMIAVGTQFDHIRYLASNAIIEGAGVVTSCNEIKKGPKSGDYSLTLQML